MMSFANLNFHRNFIRVSHPLYICKQNLQAAMDKEDSFQPIKFIARRENGISKFD